MFIYYLIFFLVILMIISYNITKNKIFLISIFSMLFILGAMRFDVGKDYSTYYKVILNYSIKYTLEFERFEFFNQIVILMSRALNFTQFYFIVTYGITMLFYYLAIERESRDKGMSILLFLAFPVLYIYAFSAVRQYVALAIIMFSFRYIFDNRFFKFLICVLIATLWHDTAILCLPMYFINKINFNRIFVLITMVIVPIIAEPLKEFILQYVRISYFFKADAGQGRKIFVFITIILVFALIFKKKLIELDSRSNFYINCMYGGYIIVSMLLSNSDMGIRLGTYYFQVLIFLVPLFALVFDKNAKTLLRYVLFVGCIVMFMMTIKSKSGDVEKTQIMPYQTFIGKDVNDLYYD